MKLLDRRHRWSGAVRDGARLVYRCRVCNKTMTYETVIPAHIDVTIAGILAKPNVYRLLPE